MTKILNERIKYISITKSEKKSLFDKSWNFIFNGINLREWKNIKGFNLKDQKTKWNWYKINKTYII